MNDIQLITDSSKSAQLISDLQGQLTSSPVILDHPRFRLVKLASHESQLKFLQYFSEISFSVLNVFKHKLGDQISAMLIFMRTYCIQIAFTYACI